MFIGYNLDNLDSLQVQASRDASGIFVFFWRQKDTGEWEDKEMLQ